MRYFHCTTLKTAKDILANGFDHRPGPDWQEKGASGDRFDEDFEWFNYYHIFFDALDPQTVRELQKTLHDDDIADYDRGKFMREFWTKKFGDQWTIIWLGGDKVFPGYGKAVLEFIPGPKDHVQENLEYHVVLHMGPKIPTSQFKLIGVFEDEWKKQNNHIDGGIDWKEAESHIIQVESLGEQTKNAAPLPKNVIEFVCAWNMYFWDSVAKYLKFDDVQEFLKSHRLDSPEYVYRGMHVSKEYLDKFLEKHHGKLEKGSEFTLQLDRPSSWSLKQKAAEDFIWMGDDGEIGLIFKTLAHPNQVLIDFNTLTDEEREQFRKESSDCDIRQQEKEVALLPGTYKAELVYICKNTNSGGYCKESTQLHESDLHPALKKMTFEKWFKTYEGDEGLAMKLGLAPYAANEIDPYQAQKWFNRRLREVDRALQNATQGSKVIVYRCMKVEPDFVEKLKNNQIKSVGAHWTISQDLAPFLCGGQGGKVAPNNIILQGEIPANQLDVDALFNPSWSEDEWEEFEVGPRNFKNILVSKVYDQRMKEALVTFDPPKKFNVYESVTEDLAKWDTGVWIHYSKLPELKINPQQFHQDPTGIYLFPESFKPEGSWFKFPYRFKCAVTTTNILDLSTLTKESAIEMLKKMVPESFHASYIEEINKAQYPLDTFWEMLKNYFVLSKEAPGKASWSKAFRDLGYDGIFDDTGSVFGNEVQLIVLDPRKVKVLERDDQKESGFKEVEEISQWLAKYLVQFGQVEVTPPKKQRPRWGEPQPTIEAHVQLDGPDKKSLSFSINTRFHDKSDSVPSEISVRLSSGAWELRNQRSIGKTFRWDKKPWDYSDLKTEVDMALKSEGLKENIQESLTKQMTSLLEIIGKRGKNKRKKQPKKVDDIQKRISNFKQQKESLDKLLESSFNSLFDKYYHSEKFFKEWLDNAEGQKSREDLAEWFGLEDGFTDEEFEERAGEWFRERFAEWESELADFISGSEITLFRCIAVVDLKKFLDALDKGKSVKGYKGIGIYWSWDEHAAECHWGASAAEATVNVMATAKVRDIDIRTTAMMNLDISCGREEKEIRLKPGSKVKIISVTDKKGEVLRDFETQPKVIAADMATDNIRSSKLHEVSDAWSKEGYTIHGATLDASDTVGWKNFIEACKHDHGFAYYKKPGEKYADDSVDDQTEAKEIYKKVKDGELEIDNAVKFPFIYAVDKAGKYVGSISFGGDEIVRNHVLPAHQRKGISSALHDFGEKENNLKAYSSSLSTDGDAFWNAREKKEDREYWGRTGAGGVIYAESTGRLLMNLRSQGVNEPGTWGTWGGMIDKNESPENALKREVKEETGYSGPMTLKMLHTFKDDDFEFHNYLITVPEEFEPKLSWESDDAKWVTLSDMPAPLHFGMVEVLPHIEQAIGGTQVEARSNNLDKLGIKISHTGDEHGALVILAKKNGKIIGSLDVDASVSRMHPNHVEVEPKWRRKGIGTAMYVYAEKLTGNKFVYPESDPDFNDPDTDLPATSDALALWDQPNRPFGESIQEDRDEQDFRYGLCGTYALALHKLTGLPLGMIYSDHDGEDINVHSFVFVSPDKMLDVNGISDIKDTMLDIRVEMKMAGQPEANDIDFEVIKFKNENEFKKYLEKTWSPDITKKDYDEALKLIKKQKGITKYMKEDLNEGPALDDFLQSRIHAAFTKVADDLCSLGYMDSDKRIKLSSAIGDSLQAFRDAMSEKAPWAKTMKVDPGHSARMVLASLT